MLVQTLYFPFCRQQQKQHAELGTADSCGGHLSLNPALLPVLLATEPGWFHQYRSWSGFSRHPSEDYPHCPFFLGDLFPSAERARRQLLQPVVEKAWNVLQNHIAFSTTLGRLLSADRSLLPLISPPQPPGGQ